MRRLAVLIVTLVLAVACAETPEAASSASTSAPPTRDTAVPEALDFQAQTVSGETFEGGEFAGQDLMLWFWAPW